jgi:hypothetical protein
VRDVREDIDIQFGEGGQRSIVQLIDKLINGQISAERLARQRHDELTQKITKLEAMAGE